MDQYPFEFKLYIAGMDVDNFLEILKSNGYDSQYKSAKAQFDKELKSLNNDN